MAGQKILFIYGKYQTVKDTIRQFFNVNREERVFGVELSIDCSQIDNIYLIILDNSISEAYPAKGYEKNKNKE
jgi:hypothetical protein